MLSRRCWLAGLGSTLLVFAVAACQAFPIGGAMPTASAPPTAPVSATDSLFDNVVWARVPDCSCLETALMDNVSAALKRANLAATVRTLSPTGGLMYFVVAYDPNTATREQIAAAIVAGGGEVMAGPP